MIIYFVIATILSLFSYALTFGHFQGKFPSIAKDNYREDMGFAILFALLTFSIPIAFIITLTLSGFGKYGLKWK